MAANLAIKGTGNERGGFLYRPGFVILLEISRNELEKAVEFGIALKEISENQAFVGREPIPLGKFVHQKVPGLHTVIDRVVQLICLEFVVLEESVIRPFREQQRGHIEGIDSNPFLRLVGIIMMYNAGALIVKQIFEVVMDDIVTADEIGIAEHPKGIVFRCRMRHCTISSHHSDIMNFIVTESHFNVQKRQFGRIGTARSIIAARFISP